MFMRTRIKVCGITNLDDALSVVEAGADALGFVFYPQSPRSIDPESAREIIRILPPLVTSVGIFVNEHIEKVQEIAKHCFLDLLQFHGEESPEYCDWFSRRVVKAFRIRDSIPLDEMKRYNVSGFLLDTYSKDLPGGTGVSFDWSLVRESVHQKPLVLAGGLTPESVGEAIGEIRPYAVDVSSGVEKSPGSKAPEKIRQFILAVQETDAAIYGMKKG
jgi:phosphoribosylanthranilate isomerase